MSTFDCFAGVLCDIQDFVLPCDMAYILFFLQAWSAFSEQSLPIPKNLLICFARSRTAS